MENGAVYQPLGEGVWGLNHFFDLSISLSPSSPRGKDIPLDFARGTKIRSLSKVEAPLTVLPLDLARGTEFTSPSFASLTSPLQRGNRGDGFKRFLDRGVPKKLKMLTVQGCVNKFPSLDTRFALLEMDGLIKY